MRNTVEFYIAQKKRHLKSNENTKKYPGYLGVKCLLSVSDVNQLLEEAGITFDQIGKGRNDYCLGRINDSGDYVMGNCRFITVAQNNKEKGSRRTIDMITEQKNRQEVTIKGVTYPSLNAAAKHFGIHRATLRKRYLNV